MRLFKITAKLYVLQHIYKNLYLIIAIYYLQSFYIRLQKLDM